MLGIERVSRDNVVSLLWNIVLMMWRVWCSDWCGYLVRYPCEWNSSVCKFYVHCVYARLLSSCPLLTAMQHGVFYSFVGPTVSSRVLAGQAQRDRWRLAESEIEPQIADLCGIAVFQDAEDGWGRWPMVWCQEGACYNSDLDCSKVFCMLTNHCPLFDAHMALIQYMC